MNDHLTIHRKFLILLVQHIQASDIRAWGQDVFGHFSVIFIRTSARWQRPGHFESRYSVKRHQQRLNPPQTKDELNEVSLQYSLSNRLLSIPHRMRETKDPHH